MVHIIVKQCKRSNSYSDKIFPKKIKNVRRRITNKSIKILTTILFNWISTNPPTDLWRVVSVSVVVQVYFAIEELCAKYLDAFFRPQRASFYRDPGAVVYFKELTGAYSIYREISSYYLRLK
jgi:hypothetical protein